MPALQITQTKVEWKYKRIQLGDTVVSVGLPILVGSADALKDADLPAHLIRQRIPFDDEEAPKQNQGARKSKSFGFAST